MITLELEYSVNIEQARRNLSTHTAQRCICTVVLVHMRVLRFTNTDCRHPDIGLQNGHFLKRLDGNDFQNYTKKKVLNLSSSVVIITLADILHPFCI